MPDELVTMEVRRQRLAFRKLHQDTKSLLKGMAEGDLTCAKLFPRYSNKLKIKLIGEEM